MKRILLLQLFLFSAFGFAQVGVNTTTPDPSSMLDVTSTNKGALFPRVSLSNINLTTLDGTNTAATGLLIWNTNAATIGGNGVGYYYFNGTIWVPVVQTGANDHDWYEVGTTVAPNAITDRMFHTGSVAIGKSTITADNPKLSIEESGPGSIFPLTIFNIKDSSTGINPHRGMTIDMEATSATSEYGIIVSHNNPNALLKYGVESIVQNGSGTNSAFQGRVRGSGLNEGIGILISDSGSPSSSEQIGHYIDFNQPTTGWTFGMRNSFNTNNLTIDSGRKFGLHNVFGANVGGDLYGTYNDFSIVSASTNNRYGTFTTISPASGGTHYGIYADATKSNSYAGYFLGRMSIGTTAFNNYILPPSRGTNGQIMQTDGTGIVSWVTPSVVTDTDNQNIDALSLTGDTLNISLIDDGVPTQTLNLSAIDNQATDVFSLTGTTLNLSLQNDGVATQTVDLSTLDTDNQNIDVLSLTGDTLNISLQDDGLPTQTLNLDTIDNQTIDQLTLAGDTLNISLQNDGAPNQTLNLSTIDNQTIDVFSFVGTTLNLSLQNDGVPAQTLDLSALSDQDWYEVGGTTTPNSINDNKYTQGSITIGTNTAATGVLDIDNATKQISLDITNTSSFLPTGVNIDINSTSSNKVGVNVVHSGTTVGVGGISSLLKTADSSIGDFNRTGLYQAFAGESTNISIDYTGVRNAFVADNFAGDMVGLSNLDNSSSNGNRYGALNSFYGTGNGVNYGVYNFFTGTGTGVKYGVYNQIATTAGGTHYGVYSNVLKTGSYAGYFLGNVSVGTSTLNNYILPPSRGTNGQIMQTDAIGNVTWVNPLTDTDDQGTDVFSLTGNTLNLSLQNDGVATQTVDLSSLAGDDDWTDVGTDIERQAGNVYIGDTAVTNNNLYISNQIIDWDNPLYYIDPDNISIVDEIEFDDGSVADPSIRFFDINTGFFSPITATTAYSANGIEAFRIHPSGDIAIGQTIDPDFKLSTSSLLGNSNVRIGNNDLNDNVIEVDHSGQLGNGLDVNMNSIYTLASRSAISANSTGRVINVDLSRYETGSPSNLFGVKSIVTDDITGVEYGVYSEALQANGFAGYFLGRMSIGTTASNNYILPASRGTNGQIMQTNAIGLVTWVNPTTIDTDDQATDIFSLSGTILNLSLQNDGVATQTVNLASLNTDNQTVDVLTLTGDTLNLSLFGDGVATQTLNLATIDNQTTDVFSLSGNTLNLSLQDDGVATQTLDLSPIANTHWTDVTTHIQPTIASKSVVIGDAVIAPVAKLSVKSDSAPTTPQIEIIENQANDDGKIKFSNTVETLNDWSIFARADDTPSLNLFNINHTIGGNIVRINGEGRVGIMRAAATNELEVAGNASKTTAGAWLANSDSRLKKNISTISPTDALNKVLSLRGVNYEWNDDKTGMKRPEGNQIGFVAQEIQEVFPEKVSEDKLGYLQTAYGDYDPIIFQAIKALSDKIDKLEKENEELKKRIEDKK